MRVLAFLLLAPAIAAADDGWGKDTSRDSSKEEAEELGLLFDVPVPVLAGSKSRTPADATLAAAHVVVVSGEEIRAFGWRTLSEVLQGVPEIHLEGQRYWPTASIRGTARSGDYNQRIVVLLDGHLLNDAISDAVGIDDGLPLFASPVVDRVEVILGPVSAVYGSNAFYGAVNIVTKKPDAPSGGALAEAGSYGYQRGLGWWTGRSAPFANGPAWEIQTFATLGRAEGGVIHGGPGVGVLDDIDWSRNGAAYLRARVGRVSFSAFGLGRRRGMSPSVYDEPDDRGRWYERVRGTGVVEAEVFRLPSVSLTAKAYGNRTFTKQRSPYGDAIAKDVVYWYRVFSEEYGGEAVLEWHRGPSTLIASAEPFYQRNFESTEDDASESSNFVSDHWEQHAVDAIWRGSIHERLRWDRASIEAGVYAESSRIHGTEAAPSAGLVLLPDRRTTVKVLYGRGFRRPSFYEYSTLDSGDYDAIHPEIVDSNEVQVRRLLGEGVAVTANAYRAEYHDLLISTDDGYRNRGEVLSTGATAGLELRREGSMVRLDATSQEARDAGGSALLASPPWIGHATALLPLLPGATLGMRASVVGPRRGLEGEPLPSIVFADVSLDVRLPARFRANLSVTNVGDARFDLPVPGGYLVIPNEHPHGRWMYLQLVWER